MHSFFLSWSQIKPERARRNELILYRIVCFLMIVRSQNEPVAATYVYSVAKSTDMASSNYTPANEKSLFQSNFLSGDNCTVLFQTEYPFFYNVSTNINLSILPNNLASLTFNITDTAFAFALGLSSIILNEHATRVPILCMYPLSGPYEYV